MDKDKDLLIIFVLQQLAEIIAKAKVAGGQVNRKFHYTLHGNPTDGWEMTVYQYVPDRFCPEHDTITCYGKAREAYADMAAVEKRVLELEAK